MDGRVNEGYKDGDTRNGHVASPALVIRTSITDQRTSAGRLTVIEVRGF